MSACKTLDQNEPRFDNLNKVMQKRMGYERPVITLDTGSGLIKWKSYTTNKFYLNDPILITKNDYTIGVRNGDLEIEEDLLYNMDHGFAVSIHKSQGSPWQSVVLVLDRAAENMLDKTPLYTGATRAQQKLIICCEDEAFIDDAVASGSIALQRNTNLLNHQKTIKLDV